MADSYSDKSEDSLSAYGSKQSEVSEESLENRDSELENIELSLDLNSLIDSGVLNFVTKTGETLNIGKEDFKTLQKHLVSKKKETALQENSDHPKKEYKKENFPEDDDLPLEEQGNEEREAESELQDDTSETMEDRSEDQDRFQGDGELPERVPLHVLNRNPSNDSIRCNSTNQNAPHFENVTPNSSGQSQHIPFASTSHFPHLNYDANSTQGQQSQSSVNPDVVKLIQSISQGTENQTSNRTPYILVPGNLDFPGLNHGTSGNFSQPLVKDNLTEQNLIPGHIQQRSGLAATQRNETLVNINDLDRVFQIATTPQNHLPVFELQPSHMGSLNGVELRSVDNSMQNPTVNLQQYSSGTGITNNPGTINNHDSDFLTKVPSVQAIPSTSLRKIYTCSKSSGHASFPTMLSSSQNSQRFGPFHQSVVNSNYSSGIRPPPPISTVGSEVNAGSQTLSSSVSYLAKEQLGNPGNFILYKAVDVNSTNAQQPVGLQNLAQDTNLRRNDNVQAAPRELDDSQTSLRAHDIVTSTTQDQSHTADEAISTAVPHTRAQTSSNVGQGGTVLPTRARRNPIVTTIATTGSHLTSTLSDGQNCISQFSGNGREHPNRLQFLRGLQEGLHLLPRLLPLPHFSAQQVAQVVFALLSGKERILGQSLSIDFPRGEVLPEICSRGQPRTEERTSAPSVPLLGMRRRNMTQPESIATPYENVNRGLIRKIIEEYFSEKRPKKSVASPSPPGSLLVRRILAELLHSLDSTSFSSSDPRCQRPVNRRRLSDTVEAAGSNVREQLENHLNDNSNVQQEEKHPPRKKKRLCKGQKDTNRAKVGCRREPAQSKVPARQTAPHRTAPRSHESSCVLSQESSSHATVPNVAPVTEQIPLPLSCIALSEQETSGNPVVPVENQSKDISTNPSKSHQKVQKNYESVAASSSQPLECTTSPRTATSSVTSRPLNQASSCEEVKQHENHDLFSSLAHSSAKADKQVSTEISQEQGNAFNEILSTSLLQELMSRKEKQLQMRILQHVREELKRELCNQSQESVVSRKRKKNQEEGDPSEEAEGGQESTRNMAEIPHSELHFVRDLISNLRAVLGTPNSTGESEQTSNSSENNSIDPRTKICREQDTASFIVTNDTLKRQENQLCLGGSAEQPINERKDTSKNEATKICFLQPIICSQRKKRKILPNPFSTTSEILNAEVFEGSSSSNGQQANRSVHQETQTEVQTLSKSGEPIEACEIQQAKTGEAQSPKAMDSQEVVRTEGRASLQGVGSTDLVRSVNGGGTIGEVRLRSLEEEERARNVLQQVPSMRNENVNSVQTRPPQERMWTRRSSLPQILNQPSVSELFSRLKFLNRPQTIPRAAVDQNLPALSPRAHTQHQEVNCPPVTTDHCLPVPPQIEQTQPQTPHSQQLALDQRVRVLTPAQQFEGQIQYVLPNPEPTVQQGEGFVPHGILSLGKTKGQYAGVRKVRFLIPDSQDSEKEPGGDSMNRGNDSETSPTKLSAAGSTVAEHQELHPSQSSASLNRDEDSRQCRGNYHHQIQYQQSSLTESQHQSVLSQPEGASLPTSVGLPSQEMASSSSSSAQAVEDQRGQPQEGEELKDSSSATNQQQERAEKSCTRKLSCLEQGSAATEDDCQHLESVHESPTKGEITAPLPISNESGHLQLAGQNLEQEGEGFINTHQQPSSSQSSTSQSAVNDEQGQREEEGSQDGDTTNDPPTVSSSQQMEEAALCLVQLKHSFRKRQPQQVDQLPTQDKDTNSEQAQTAGGQSASPRPSNPTEVEQSNNASQQPNVNEEGVDGGENAHEDDEYVAEEDWEIEDDEAFEQPQKVYRSFEFQLGVFTSASATITLTSAAAYTRIANPVPMGEPPFPAGKSIFCLSFAYITTIVVPTKPGDDDTDAPKLPPPNIRPIPATCGISPVSAAILSGAAGALLEARPETVGESKQSEETERESGDGECDQPMGGSDGVAETSPDGPIAATETTTAPEHDTTSSSTAATTEDVVPTSTGASSSTDAKPSAQAGVDEAGAGPTGVGDVETVEAELTTDGDADLLVGRKLLKVVESN